MTTVSAAELDVTNHAGKPLPADGIFLTPPPEIGKVLSASTSMRPGKLPWFDIFTAVLTGLLVGLIVFWQLSIFRGFKASDEALNLVFTGLAFAIGVFIKFPLPCVRYVGEKGVYHWSKVFGKEQSKCFLFTPEARCTADVFEMRHDGVPSGTNYIFKFTSPEASAPFYIGGRFLDFLSKVHPDNSYYFARSAEAALQSYLHTYAIQALAAGKPVLFSLTDGSSLELTSTALTLRRGGKEKYLSLRDFKKAALCNGSVTLHTHQTPSVFLIFALSTLANAPLLLQLLHELTAAQRQQKAA
jgi:hypothetical protein